MKKFLFIFLSFFELFCSKESCIKREEFTDIYADILIISANTTISNTQRKFKIDSLLKARGYSEQMFECTVKSFSENPEEWKDIYKEVLDKLEMKKLKK